MADNVSSEVRGALLCPLLEDCGGKVANHSVLHFGHGSNISIHIDILALDSRRMGLPQKRQQYSIPNGPSSLNNIPSC